MSYTPPSNTQMPFTFTQGGYSAPTGELLFEFAARTSSFSSLNAAIQVMQLYHDETYTYVKSCPKHIIGYADGKVQILKGPCTFGGIRDLWGSIVGIDILSQAADLPGSIHGWQQLDLYANILMHPPEDLAASIFVKSTAYTDLDTSIHAWHVKDLQARLDRVFPFDLSGIVYPIQPVDLSAYLKVRYVDDLKTTLRGWAIKDLSAAIEIIFARDLNIKIHGRDDTTKNLYFKIKGEAIEVQSLLSASINPFISKDLNASLIATYIGNLSACLFPVRPKDISANIYAWHRSDLQVLLNGQYGPGDLLASIVPNTNLRFLGATICSKSGTNILSNLPTKIHSWETRNLTSSISLIAAKNLRATLIPFGYSANLHVSIYPKTIRLTTTINVVTMAHRNLSAMINSFCVFTGHKNLSASVHVTYKSDLSAQIMALRYTYKQKSLGARIGYADTITEVDKYKISFNVLEGEMRTFDRYQISFDAFGAIKYLSACIKGIMQSVPLSASITAKEIQTFSFGKIKGTEKVVQLSYAGVFEASEVVELAFKSLVSDYYYSSDGDQAWKTNRLDRWILELKSYLPKNEILKLRRRLHRGTELYDLRKFSSIDEAMRHAIAYVTEYPQSDLGASIYCRGRYKSLGATISPRYVKSGGMSLSGILTPVEHTIIVGTEQGNIIKL